MRHKCPTCGQSFKQIVGWWNHATAKGHAFDWQFTCDNCDHPFKNAEALQKHRNKKHNIEAQDEIKNLAVKVEPSPSNTTTASTQSWRCTECPGDFEPEALFGTHFTISDNHPSCPRCKTGMSDLSALKIHMGAAHPLVHCDACNIATYRDEKQQHDEAHLNAVLLSCMQCGQGYATKIALREHYSDPATGHPMCALCSVGFADDAECNQHMSASHPPKSVVRSLETKLRNKPPDFMPSGVGYASTDASSPEVSSEVEHAVTNTQHTEEKHGSGAALPQLAPRIPAATSIGIKSILIKGTHHRTLEDLELLSASEPMSKSPDLVSLSSTSVESLPESLADLQDRAPSPQPSQLPATPSPAPAPPPVPNSAVGHHVPGSVAARATHIDPASTVSEPRACSADVEAAAPSNLEAKGNRMAHDVLPKSKPKAAALRRPSTTCDSLAEHTPEAPESAESVQPDTDASANGRAKDNNTRLTAKPHVVARPPATTSLWHCRMCFKDPCEDPTATICGHMFCHECIAQELVTNHRCPVCKSTMLVRLNVGK